MRVILPFILLICLASCSTLDSDNKSASSNFYKFLLSDDEEICSQLVISLPSSQSQLVVSKCEMLEYLKETNGWDTKRATDEILSYLMNQKEPDLKGGKWEPEKHIVTDSAIARFKHIKAQDILDGSEKHDSNYTYMFSESKNRLIDTYVLFQEGYFLFWSHGGAYKIVKYDGK